MKYGLAIIKNVLETYGFDLCIGYDIMCTFIKTLHKSSLAKIIKKHHFVGVVPAFHGHAHNQKCQVHWHPTYTEGVGTEDFEECERTFCASNDLTPVTQLATPFHHRQEIQEHFHFHNMDKQLNIGLCFSALLSALIDPLQAAGCTRTIGMHLIGSKMKNHSLWHSSNLGNSPQTILKHIWMMSANI
jgi:hypothetical protein